MYKFHTNPIWDISGNDQYFISLDLERILVLWKIN